MPKWSVTVEAFGHVSVRNVEAATRREAEEQVLRSVGFRVQSHEQGAKAKTTLDNYSRKV